MDVRVLGPLQVCDGAGREVALGGAKQRRVLAVLALEAGRVVSTDRIVEEVWGADPPAGSLATLQVYISNLRRALRSAGDREVIITRRPGYLLDLSPDRTDAIVFEALLTDGLKALEVGRAEPAAEMLRAALRLWRGPMLEDVAFSGDFAYAVRRFDERRVDAFEAVAAAELAAGRHQQLLPELEAAVLEHPLREALWAHLILVLYRSGRQADALRTFARARTLLAEELGIDPGPELRALETRILRQDPKLAVRSDDGVARVPVAAVRLVAREHEIARVQELLSEGARIVTLTGMGGIGKSRLAIALADEIPGEVVWAGLSACADVEQAVDAIARALGVARDSAGPPLDMIIAALDGRSLTLIVDNCEHVAAISTQLAALLAASKGLRVLATSRSALRISGEHELAVPPLALPAAPEAANLAEAPAGALELFLIRAAAVSGERALDQEDYRAMAQICRLLDGVPLAIELAAARLKIFSTRQLLERLSRPLSVLVAGPRDLPERQQTLQATLNWSWDLLSGAERITLQRAAVFAGPFGIDSLEELSAAVPGEPVDTALALAALLEHGFIRFDSVSRDLRLVMLFLVRQYVADRLDRSGEADAVRGAHARQMLGLATRLGGGLLEVVGRDAEAGLAEWLPDLRIALDWSLERESTGAENAAAAVIAMWRVWISEGLLPEGRRWMGRLLARSAELGPLSADVHCVAGVFAYLEDDYGTAVTLLSEAGRLAEAGADRPRWTVARSWLVSVHLSLNELEVAKDICAELLEPARRMNCDEALHRALFAAAWLAYASGDPGEAQALTEEDLALSLRRGDQLAAVLSLNNLAELALEDGRTDDAVPYVQQLTQVAERLGTSVALLHASLTRGLLGLCRRDAGQASRFYGEALRRGRDLGQRTETTIALRGLAAAAGVAGRDEECVRLFAAASRMAAGYGGRDQPEGEMAVVWQEVRERMPESLFERAWMAGQGLDAEAIFAEAGFSRA